MVRSCPGREDYVAYLRDRLPADTEWLIDRAGLKGVRHGEVGTYAKQALVMVNHGGASGRDILAFSEFVQQTVKQIFGVELEREVQLFGQPG